MIFNNNNYASLAAQRLRLVISDNGNLVKRPHMAFEKDLIALYLASFQTAEITTKNGKGGKSWIDASKGIGDKLNTSELINQARLYPFRMLG